VKISSSFFILVFVVSLFSQLGFVVAYSLSVRNLLSSIDEVDIFEASESGEVCVGLFRHFNITWMYKL